MSDFSATGAIKPFASPDLELDAEEARLSKDEERLIIEPIKRRRDLATVLAGWGALDEPMLMTTFYLWTTSDSEHEWSALPVAT